MSVLTGLQSGVAVAVLVPGDVQLSAVELNGGFMSITGLGALLDGMCALWDGQSVTRLHSSYLVDLNLSLGWMLYVDIHQGRVEGHCTWNDTAHPA